MPPDRIRTPYPPCPSLIMRILNMRMCYSSQSQIGNGDGAGVNLNMGFALGPLGVHGLSYLEHVSFIRGYHASNRYAVIIQ